ncbi:MAG TPA: non-homologous end-joining DNA ligase [Thermoleophilaceae bacterium]|nr:non-homologous end-joining DNA ligase [Thermoleophilaceae bacterium]
MADRLRDYRDKRDFAATPEPTDEGASAVDDLPRFVVQEHHASHLHWDLRLEREGTLASWAVPRGIPDHPQEDRLAVRTEDHPLKYLEFEGEIPAGNYGAGTMAVWDSGTYELEKWRDDEVMAVFHGERVQGRYVLFRTGGKNWMIHRMDPPAPGVEPMPEAIEPMKARLGELPRDEDAFAYEVKWDGIRAVARIDRGHLDLTGRNGTDYRPRYPELRPLGGALGSTRAILDGEIVAFDEQGRPSFERLQSRMHLAGEAAIKRRSKQLPVTYVIFDLLWLDGHMTTGLAYRDRRRLLEELELDGPNWRTPTHHESDGAALLHATREQGLEGIVAKRLDSTYEPGRRSGAWIKIKNVLRQEVVIGGWARGEGKRAGSFGALCVGVHDDEGKLRYVGKVGTGFDESMLALLTRELTERRRDSSPFEGRQPPRGTLFVEPDLVAEVELREWTRTGTLRAPAFKGLRDDADPAAVVRES